MSSARPLLGRVASFDGVRGLGEVVDDAGRTFGFHATAIAGGGRTIEVGTAVALTAVPGHGGRYEARRVVPLPSGD